MENSIENKIVPIKRLDCAGKNSRIENWLKSFVSFSIPFLPLLEAYSFPGFSSISMSEFFLLFLLVLCFVVLLYTRKRIVFPFLLFFCLYGVLTTFLNSLLFFPSSYLTGLIRIVRDFIYIFFFAFSVPSFGLYPKIYKWYKRFSIFCCSLTYFELISYYVFHKTILFLLPFFTLNYGGLTYDELLIIREAANAKNYFRSISCFAEPSYYSYYLFPFFFLLLFSKEKSSKKIILSLFFLGSLLIAKSATGFVLAAVIICIFFYFQAPLSKKFKIAITPILIFLSIGVILSGNIFSRFSELFDFSGNETSGGFRIYRGYLIFSQLSPVQKIFGIGYGNIIAFFRANNIVAFSGEQEDFASSICYTLISTGFIGFCLFAASLIIQASKQQNKTFTLFLIIIFLLFSVDILYFSSFYILLMSLLFCNNDDSKTDESAKQLALRYR